MEEIQEWRGKGEWVKKEIVRKEKENQNRERWAKIGKSRYNKWYKWIKGKGVSEYLKKG